MQFVHRKSRKNKNQKSSSKFKIPFRSQCIFSIRRINERGLQGLWTHCKSSKIRENIKVSNHWTLTSLLAIFSHRFVSLFFRKWLDANTQIAKERVESQQIVRDDLEKLEKWLKNNLKLKDIQYDCAWNVDHLRGCLKSLVHLYKMHTNEFKCLEGMQHTCTCIDIEAIIWNFFFHRSNNRICSHFWR